MIKLPPVILPVPVMVVDAVIAPVTASVDPSKPRFELVDN